jgi:transposase
MIDKVLGVQIGIGIDTARYGHHVSFLDEKKRTAAKAFHFTETPDGYQRLHQAFQRLAKKHGQLHLRIHVDAAGQYAENLLQWLRQLPFDKTVSVGQPARNKAYRKVHFDKRKADPAESLACARFAIVERPEATPHNPPQFRQLRDVVAMREAASKAETRLVNQLHGLLARVFPELALHVKDLSASYVLTLLDKYPTPEKLAGARLATLAKIPHLNEDTAQTLQAAAANSLGSNQGPFAEQMVRQKVRQLRQQQDECAKIDKLIKRAWEALPEGAHRRILTIPGIGIQTAVALVAKIVSIDRFQTAGALVGYFGVFPEEVDVSGTDRRGNPKQAREEQMSRKGNDLVRRLLYTAAQCATKYNPPVKELFARQMANNKEYNLAIGHCMAKLLRQVFALWTKDQDFEPHFESRRAEQQAAEAVQEKTAASPKADQPPEKEVTAATCKITPAAGVNKLPPLDFAKLRQMVSISQVLQHVNWQPRKRRGDQWRGGCPIHEEIDTKSEAFAVETKKSVYCCHRCGNEGNALDLWTALSDKPILAAAWDLVRAFGLDPPLLE